MIDRETVMEGIKACANIKGECRECPYHYFNGLRCIAVLTQDALELLNHDQETIESLQHTINELTKSISE